MEQTQVSGGAQLSGNVLFYTKPEPLNPQLHGKLGVNRADKPFGFVAQSHLVPLTVTEFAPAALSYPIVFLGDQKTPLAVMGLSQGDNLFVSGGGEFRPDAYVPAYVRRYPFVFANDEQSQRMILCIDRGAAIIGEGAEVPFFDGDQPSEYTKSAMQFCTDFETERQRTEQFVKLLTDLDLFTTRESVFRPTNPDGTQGQPQKLAEYWAVDEQKLNALPQDKFLELRANGALSQIYCHLVSLLGWDKLVALAFQRAQQQPQAGNA